MHKCSAMIFVDIDEVDLGAPGVDWARHLVLNGLSVQDRWGYFIAYEDDIAAVNSWSELKNRVERVGYPKQ